MERTLAAWRKYDAKLEDELFRRLSGPRPNSPATVARAEQLVEKIIAGDLDRVAALFPTVQAALVVGVLAET